MASRELEVKITADMPEFERAMRKVKRDLDATKSAAYGEHRLRIVSEGIGTKTAIFVGDKPVRNVESVTWTVDAAGTATATIVAHDVPVDVLALTVKHERPRRRRWFRR